MVVDLLVNVLASAFDFLRGSFLLSIPIFFLFLIGYFFSKKILERFKLSWIKKTFISIFFVFVLLILIFYVFPVIDAALAVDLGVIPEAYIMTLPEFLSVSLYLFGKMLISAFVFSIFVLPLAFVGAFAFEYLDKKFKWNQYIKFFLSCFSSTAVGLFIVLFLIPWVIPGAIYFLYFG